MPACMVPARVYGGAQFFTLWVLVQNMYASAPKSTVGTVAYIAPEVLTCKRDHTKYKVRPSSLSYRSPCCAQPPVCLL